MTKYNEKVYRDLRFLNQKVEEIFAHFGDPFPDRELAKVMDLMMKYLMSFPEFKTINDLSVIEQHFLTSKKSNPISSFDYMFEKSHGKYTQTEPLFGPHN